MGTVTAITHAGWCSGKNPLVMTPDKKDFVDCVGECLKPMLTEAELKKQEEEHYAKIAGMTSHELARKLLELPEGKLTFVAGASGAYTHDLGLKSNPWFVDWAKEVRISVGDTSVAVRADL